MPRTFNGLTRGFKPFRKSQSPLKQTSVEEVRKEDSSQDKDLQENSEDSVENGKIPSTGSSAASRKRSPNTRTSTVSSESRKSKRHLLGSTPRTPSTDNNKKENNQEVEGGGCGGGVLGAGEEETAHGAREKMETDACATETLQGGTGTRLKFSSASASTSSTSNSSSGYSSSRSNNKGSRGGGSKSAESAAAPTSATSTSKGKENRVPSSSIIASCKICGGHDHSVVGSPVPRIKNRPHRSFAGLSHYEQFLRFTETDPKYRSEKSQGKILGMYKFCGEIGSGNFSKVKLGIHQLTKERVAIKIIEKSRVQEKMEKMLSREVRSMEVLQHPNMIRLYEVMETGTKIYLISEWAPAGDLYSKVTLRGKLPEYDAKPIFRQILSAMLYMHGNGVIHRDLKAENVFFSTGTICKLGDFGFSTTGYKGQLLTTFCGSPPYAAPELYRDEAYEGGPVDCWALGVLLYFMTEGRLPFIGTSIPNLKRNILNGEYMMSGNLSEELMDLIQKILQQRPSRRLTIPEMILHPWLDMDSDTEPFCTYDSPSKLCTSKSADAGDGCSVNMSARQTHCSVIRRDTNGKLFPTTVNRAMCRSIPTKEQILYKLVPPKEIQSYEILLDIGLPESMVEAHRARGVRSHVIGIYRMILHKLEKGDEIDFAKFSMASMTNSMMNFNSHSLTNEIISNTQQNHHHHHHHQHIPAPGGEPPPPVVKKGPLKMNSNHSPVKLQPKSQDGGEEIPEESPEGGESSPEKGDESKVISKDIGEEDDDVHGPHSELITTKISGEPQDIENAVANCQAVPSTTCTIL